MDQSTLILGHPLREKWHQKYIVCSQPSTNCDLNNPDWRHDMMYAFIYVHVTYSVMIIINIIITLVS